MVVLHRAVRSERRVEDAACGIAGDPVATDHDDSIRRVDRERAGVCASTEIGLSAAATSESQVQGEVGIETVDAEPVVHGSDGEDLARGQDLHVVDVVDAGGDGEHLLAGGVERRVENGRHRGGGWARREGRWRDNRYRDGIGIGLGPAAPNVS